MSQGQILIESIIKFNKLLLVLKPVTLSGRSKLENKFTSEFMK